MVTIPCLSLVKNTQVDIGWNEFTVTYLDPGTIGFESCVGGLALDETYPLADYQVGAIDASRHPLPLMVLRIRLSGSLCFVCVYFFGSLWGSRCLELVG